jgi:hypothetical protein
MRQRRFRWGLRAVLAGGVGVLAFAALTSVGAAVSPSGLPAASEQYPEKVTICHRTHSTKNPFVTIRVSRNALNAHLRHGDTIGPCSTAPFTLCQKGKTIKVKGSKAAVKHLRRGAKLGKCKKPKKNKANQRGTRSEKQKAKPEKQKGKPADKPDKGSKKDKPAEAPSTPGDRGKGPKK